MGKGPVSKQTRGLPPLVRALAFGCILLALLLCTQEVLAPKGGCIDGFYAEPEDTIDVIFLGSSHANAAFAPAQMWREQGFTGYVLYSWSQPMWVSYHYAVEAFKRQTPRVACGRGRHLGRLFAAHPAVPQPRGAGRRHEPVPAELAAVLPLPADAALPHPVEEPDGGRFHLVFSGSCDHGKRLRPFTDGGGIPRAHTGRGTGGNAHLSPG